MDIREYIRYDPENGSFTWIKSNRSPRCRVGKAAGYINNEGYRIIKFNGLVYKGSHVAFFTMTGKWPQLFIDHINRVRHDNRWINLREADRSLNGRNRACWHRTAIWRSLCETCNPKREREREREDE